jgi:hypothetical protein
MKQCLASFAHVLPSSSFTLISLMLSKPCIRESIMLGYKIGGSSPSRGWEFSSSMEPTHPPIQWVQGALSLGIKWLGCEADHLLPSSSKVKECMELYLHSPKYTFMVWCSKHRNNFT